MGDSTKRVEAVLFTLGRFVNLEEMSKMCNIGSIGYLKEALNRLKEEYEQKDCSLEVIEQAGKWKLGLKKEFLYLTESLLENSELDRPCQETLAVVAYKQPVLQSEIIKIRGNSAYDHIKSLKENDFITSEKTGRTRLLKLTPKFYDYFDVVDDTLKRKLTPSENNKNEEKE